MRVAFYAPLKAPTHPVPSGDRLIGRLLMAALERAGHQVELASCLRSYDRTGDEDRQRRLERIGGRLADRLLRRYERRARAARPAAWFTYHLYHKAPDHLGPRVSARLGIPYVVAEASHAAKQRTGPWRRGYECSVEALRAASAIVSISSNDVAGVRQVLGSGANIVELAPFLDLCSVVPRPAGVGGRCALAREHRLDPDPPWLVAVAMMRPGNKLDSYRVLARSLGRLLGRDWRLLVVGDGPARAEVRAALGALPAERVRFTGSLPAAAVATVMAAADVFVWPSVSEPLGMVFLEAQAAGLPVVAGHSRGVGDIVRDRVTGRLVPPGDADAFAGALADLLDDPAARRRLGEAGARVARERHDLPAAARVLDRVLAEAVADA